ncbi:Ig-like domain-containing protein [Candidatus Palauibacter sp.]|uniref:Ig-like domain-containing protein n=1 Tax=Candidatus Palauibacter sp. TaxID=3101350 RepID=UPI003B5A0503
MGRHDGRHHLIRSLAVLALLAGITSCGGDGTTDPPPPPPPPAPVAPVAVGSIPAQVMTAGQSVTVDVSPFFSDPDGGALTYTAASSDDGVVSVSLSGSNLTVTAVAAGTATVTVTATDPDGLTATQTAGVTVEAANNAPEAVGTIPAQSMKVGDAATVDVSPFFSDPDGDELTYTAESSDADVVAVGIEGSSLTVTAAAEGTATVTVTAADPDGLTAAQSAEVTVEAANRAPEAVGTIPAQSMKVGDAVMVDVSPFFSDPDGDELTYTAESSDADVVAVGIEGSSLTVTAAAEGTATVTVTAADPDGLTAAQSAEVTVEAANRAPEAVGTIPAQTMKVGDAVMVDVSPFFSDPDGDELTYTAESSDADVVAVGIEGSSLTVTAAAEGTATVTVTAADPDGLTAMQSAEITVEEEGAGFRDDFDSDASLDDWEIRNADAEIEDGLLRLISSTDGRLGIAEREVDPILTDWTIRVRMGRAADEGTVRVYWFTEDVDFSASGVSVGPADEQNYRFLLYSNADEAWYWISDFSGRSDAVRDAPGEFTELTIARDGEEVFLAAGDTELWRFTPSTTTVAGVNLENPLRMVSNIWLAGGGGDGTTQLFDWIDVTGTESSADMSGRSGAARRLDLAREALEASVANPIRLDGPAGTRRNRNER